ncbi:hypothetical protein Rruber_03727 [Rhodococcus ruber]|uniref:hypothetical protein n=1 Tax=Rhodococcus ruber TaxID=1830 RepID=UPI00315C740B
MHVEGQLFTSSFEITVDSVAGKAQDVLPEWNRADRFGLIVDEPLGGLGASLLVQLAIAEFYRVRRINGYRPVVYPELYVLHVGGPHGDFSNFDSWPPRKEVPIPNRNPVQLLEVLNNYAITRLALPARLTGSTKTLETGITTWADKASFLDRTRSCFLYGPGGQIGNADVEIASVDARVQENVLDTLFPVAAATEILRQIESGERTVFPGHSVLSDVTKWAERVGRRAAEVSAEVREGLSVQYRNRLEEGGARVVETYKRVSPLDALAHVAGL